MNKICVYAICKNESQFVDKWYESVKEADEIIVVDTGSKDNTVELLNKYEKIKVYEKNYNPWRFDTPRNYALSRSSSQCNIFVSIDLDEVFEPGWVDILREEWVEGLHSRAVYKYAWSHTEDGQPARIFMANKIHNLDWHWQYPVHETLARGVSSSHSEEETLNLWDKIYIHHYPDKTKSRGSYFHLLKKRVEEDLNSDWYGRLYLAHEYYYQGLYKECIEFIEKSLLPHKQKYDNIEISNIYYFKGNCYKELNETGLAIVSYSLGIEADNLYRENYLGLADIYNLSNRYNSAIGVIEDCLLNTSRRYSWLEKDTSWVSDPYDLLSVAYFYKGDYAQSYYNVTKALKLNPLDNRLQSNKILIENKIE